MRAMGGRRWRMWVVDRVGDDGQRRKNRILLVAACRQWMLLGLTLEITKRVRFQNTLYTVLPCE